MTAISFLEVCLFIFMILFFLCKSHVKLWYCGVKEESYEDLTFDSSSISNFLEDCRCDIIVRG